MAAAKAASAVDETGAEDEEASFDFGLNEQHELFGNLSDSAEVDADEEAVVPELAAAGAELTLLTEGADAMVPL